MNSPRTTIFLERQSIDRPWGFRLQGGNDFPVPLSIQLVNPNTPAQINGLEAGDQVVSINDHDVTNLTHDAAKMEITRAGNELALTVIKGAMKKPSLQGKNESNQTTIEQNQTSSKSNDGRGRDDRSYETAKGTYWSPNEQPKEIPENLQPKVTNFESSPAYNRDPLQREVWRPKAYRDNPEAPSRQVGTAVYHAQYNSPIGLYSDDKVLEAFKTQTAGLIEEIKGSPMTTDEHVDHHPSSPTYQAVMNRQPTQGSIPCSSEGKISRSFRMLEQDLQSVQGTTQAPKSIFDQRRQQQKR